jgi:hypothetical protein
MRVRYALLFAVLAPAACSITSSLDDLKQDPGADAGSGGSGGSGGTAGSAATGGSGGTSLSCESGACAGCVGCEAFCTCSTRGSIAREHCIKGCKDGGSAGSAGAAGAGGNAGAAGAGGTPPVDAGQKQQCLDCLGAYCNTELQACMGTAGCVELWNCIGACGADSVCQNACIDSAPASALPAVESLAKCMNDSCSQPCS